jgi:CHAD domain-containing protein
VASFALDLPAEAEAHKLSRTLRKLGAPRDTEAVATTLRLAAGLPASSPGAGGDSDSTLAPAEREALDALLGELDGARRRGFAEATACLGSRDVRRVLAARRSFDGKPTVLPFGNRDESDAVARALTRVAGQLFAHDGWELSSLTGTEKEPWEHLLGVSAPRCEQIHSLRKAIREMRYCMENFLPLYDTLDAEATRHFKAQLAALVELQTHIGTMHDVQVCIQVLADTCGGGGSGAAAALGAHVDWGKGKHNQAKRAFPQLTAALRSRFDDAWAEFQKGRERMLSREGQQQLYAALLGSL